MPIELKIKLGQRVRFKKGYGKPKPSHYGKVFSIGGRDDLIGIIPDAGSRALVYRSAAELYYLNEGVKPRGID